MEKEVVKDKKIPLGIRLNNPLNIRKSTSKWIGAVEDGSKGQFVRFKSPFYGWRAALIIMAKTYYKRGWNTPDLIIENWAPYTENNTPFYKAFVEKYSGIPLNETMPPLPDDPKKWRRLLVAMAKIEVGYRWISFEMLKELQRASADVIAHY